MVYTFYILVYLVLVMVYTFYILVSLVLVMVYSLCSTACLFGSGADSANTNAYLA